MTPSFTLAGLAALTGAEAVEGACEGPVTGVAALAEATSADLSFLGNAKYADAVASSKAGAILVPVAFAGKPCAGQDFLRVHNSSYASLFITPDGAGELWRRTYPESRTPKAKPIHTLMSTTRT